MGRLNDKVVIVTGATTGIGKVSARRSDEGRALAGQIAAEGGSAIFVQADVSVASDPAVHEKIPSIHPIGRFADPIEQAEAVLFLLSDKASYVTGTVLPVDGAMPAP